MYFPVTKLFQHFAPLILALYAPPYPIAAPELDYELIAEKVHDSAIFTQGMELDSNDMLVSSGQYGRSFVRRYNLTSGEVLEELKLPQNQFAEGLTVVGKHLYLLTWKEQVLYILDKNNLKPLYKLGYKGEGWGLAFNGSHLIMSDGSAELTFRDKKDFSVKRKITVKDKGKAVQHLNELEYARQSLWANVWTQNRILQIDTLSGVVVGELRLDDLVKQNGNSYTRVLNGIAYDREADAFWISGKYWPKKYLVKVKQRKH